MEEPRESHRQVGGEACLAGEDRSEARPCLLPEGGATHRLQAAPCRCVGGSGEMGFVGQTLQDSRVREATKEHRQTPRSHPDIDPARTKDKQWANRINEYENTAHHQSRIRIQIVRGLDRSGNAQSRRSETGAPGEGMTHGYVSRAEKQIFVFSRSPVAARNRQIEAKRLFEARPVKMD